MNCRGFFPERTRRKLQNPGSNSVTKGVSSRFILTLFVKKPTLSNYHFLQPLKYIVSRLIRYFQGGGVLQFFRGVFMGGYIGGVFFSQKPSLRQRITGITPRAPEPGLRQPSPQPADDRQGWRPRLDIVSSAPYGKNGQKKRNPSAFLSCSTFDLYHYRET